MYGVSVVRIREKTVKTDLVIALYCMQQSHILPLCWGSMCRTTEVSIVDSVVDTSSIAVSSTSTWEHQNHLMPTVRKNPTIHTSQEWCFGSLVVFCKLLLRLGNGCFHPYPSGFLHWHWGNHTIAPVPVKQPWRIHVNQWHKSNNF